MKYVALYRHGGDSYSGTLSEIHEEMDGDGRDPEDFSFYELGKAVTIAYEKKLVLVPTGVKPK